MGRTRNDGSNATATARDARTVEQEKQHRAMGERGLDRGWHRRHRTSLNVARQATVSSSPVLLYNQPKSQIPKNQRIYGRVLQRTVSKTEHPPLGGMHARERVDRVQVRACAGGSDFKHAAHVAATAVPGEGVGGAAGPVAVDSRLWTLACGRGSHTPAFGVSRNKNSTKRGKRRRGLFFASLLARDAKRVGRVDLLTVLPAQRAWPCTRGRHGKSWCLLSIR